jgi:hypothetical protein
MPDPVILEESFCGVSHSDSQTQPKHICLHKETVSKGNADTVFDIDSYLGFADSLAFAKSGIEYCATPLIVQNITSDLHINHALSGADSEQPFPATLWNIPHFRLGHVTGASEIAIYILCPHLPIEGETFFSLTHNQLRRWTDGLLIPALEASYDPHITQHYAASFRNAYNDSRAHQVEMRQTKKEGLDVQQTIYHHLFPDRLGEVWNHILRSANNEEGLRDFRKLQLFFTAKGTKLRHKGIPDHMGLLHTMDTFRTFLENKLDLTHVNISRMWLDIGKETCRSRSNGTGVDTDAHVYLWKRCCLESYIKWMYDEKPPAKNGDGQRYYSLNMLYDTSNLTSVSPKRSKQHQGGLIYSQFYSSTKEMYDANKTYPFQNDAMEELALDPSIRETARRIEGGGTRRDAQVVLAAYLASKRRIYKALQDTRRKSYGLREEHRITWTLFLGLIDHLRENSAEEQQDEISCLDQVPSYAWTIPTTIYNDFLRRSVNKFAAGFEIIHAKVDPRLVTWSETQMMAMFLRCLRFVLGAHQLSREAALWWSRREYATEDVNTLDRVYFGLGFSNTLSEYKYCWLEPVVDWTNLTFKAEFRENMLFGNSVLQRRYLTHTSMVKTFFDTTRKLDLALELLHESEGKTKRRNSNVLIEWIAHICLLQFRIDVLETVKKEIKEEWREEALLGGKGFSVAYFNQIMELPFTLVSGNKTLHKHPKSAIEYIFGRASRHVPRAHWERRPFRTLLWRARDTLERRGKETGREHNKREFEQAFIRVLYRFHWLLPYPTTNALTQTSKQKERMWYSIIEGTGKPGIPTRSQLATDAPRLNDQHSHFEWGASEHRDGLPDELPDYMQWSRENWQRWVKDCKRRFISTKATQQLT